VSQIRSQSGKNQGFRVAFIPRPQEFGPNGKVDLSSEPYFDIMANSVIDLGVSWALREREQRWWFSLWLVTWTIPSTAENGGGQ